MRKINKSEPKQFKRFRQTNHQNQWDKFSNGKKKRCKDYILNIEQKGLSSYTEMPIKQYIHLKNLVHFDHFIKQEFDELKIFDWNNLFIDIHRHAEGKTYIEDDKDFYFGADYKDTHIETEADNQKIINPATANPHHFFAYMCNGEMTINNNLSIDDNDCAKLTRDKAFNLNDPILKKKREDLCDLIITDYLTLPPRKALEQVREYGFISCAEFMLDKDNLY